ncbi:hypothetical protein [Phenylobacterium sp.]|uniref:alpha/beta hydrolase family protein n=1 Tax=Phenylobacterium sp. TaxID=1871053 RepID=UPI0025F16D7A|nr:hypothetical protein [Phenylobacterium sp.]
MGRAWRRTRGLAGKLRRALTPSSPAWTAASWALVGVWGVWLLAMLLVDPFPSYIPIVLAGEVGPFVWFAGATLGLILLAWVVAALPGRFRAALFLALPPSVLLLMFIWGEAGAGIAAAILLILASLAAGSVAALRRRDATRGGRIFAGVVLGLTLLLAAASVTALVWPPRDDDKRPVLHVDARASTLPDPGLNGPYAVETFTYGSGSDPHRPEYAGGVRFRTRAVDASKLDQRWQGLGGWLRTKYWGFDPKAFPIQGRVWAPKGPGPFPLVLIVHGNHSMERFSDGGYAYLGELLASQGFITVSVDENFINSSAADDVDLLKTRHGEENDARAWLLLQHLAQWRAWSDDPAHPMHGKVDFDRLALVGHSRGGEAVATAAAFNRLAAYPDDATLPFRFGFNIRAVAAIAPVDGQYKPRDRPTPLKDVDYFVIHGSLDGDLTSFMGQAQYERATFSPGFDGFKASLYVKGANHGQFNTSWGRNDLGAPHDFLLDERPILPPEAQRQVMKVYLSAFLRAALNGQDGYRALLADPRAGARWLPPVVLVGNYADSRTTPLATFDEDLDPATGADATIRLIGHNLSVHRETYGKLKFHDLDTQIAIVAWDERVHRAGAAYGLEFTTPRALAAGSSVVFAAADADTSTLPEGFKPPKEKKDKAKPKSADGLDWTVVLTDAGGREARVPLSSDERLYPRIVGRTRRAPWIDFDPASELVLRRFRLPVAAFARANPQLDLSQVRSLRFDFDRSPRGAVALDDIGIAPGP